MKKFTKLWQLMIVLMLTSSVVFAQGDFKNQTEQKKQKKQVEQLKSVSNVQSEAGFFENGMTKEEYKMASDVSNSNITDMSGYLGVDYIEIVKPVSNFIYNPKDFPTPKQGGEDIATAVVLSGALPINSTGTTAGYVDNYDEVCPYTGSTAPDVVYSYTPAATMDVVVDLCGSSYDTKVYMYEAPYTAGDPAFACNDDFYTSSGDPCGQWVSQIDSAHLIGGTTYYIVIDGYSGADFGDYMLEIRDWVPPPSCVWGVDIDCPAGSIAESEVCGTGTNDGCNMAAGTETWEPVPAAGGTICGTTWADGGTRDTDWFELVLAAKSTVVLTANSDQAIVYGPISDVNGVIINPDCATAANINPAEYAGPCNETTLDLGELDIGTYWFFVGMTVYEGFPCTNVHYYIDFDITEVTCPNPIDATTINIATTTADAQWDRGGTETDWNIAWGLPGFTPGVDEIGSTTLTDAGAGPFTVNMTGFAMATDYEWAVQADCLGGSESGWTTTAFTTKCEISIPLGATSELEACGDDTNGGCNMPVPAFETVSDGETLHGTAWAFDDGSGGATRDTDWFELVLAAPATVTMTMEGEAPMIYGLIAQNSPGCPGCDQVFGVYANYSDICASGTVTTDPLPAGTYYFFVAIDAFDGYPCTIDYLATWAVTPYTATAGEFCSNAIPASLGVNNAAQQPVWYSFVGNDKVVGVTSCITGQTTDTDLEVYDDCCGNLIAANDDDGVCSETIFASTLEFFAAAGTTYYLHWLDTYEVGAFDFEITEGLPVITVSPASFTEDVVVDGGAMDHLMIGNTGDFDLNYTGTINYTTPFTAIFEETFDTEIPVTWTHVIYSETGDWMWENTGTNDFTGTDGFYAEADSDENNTDIYDVGLFTPSIDLSAYTNVYLDFDRDFQDYVGDGYAEVNVYSGGTAAGNFEMNLWNQGTDDPTGGVHSTFMFDASALTSPGDVYIEFYYSTEGGTYAWYFRIDNVVLSETGLPAMDWLSLDGASSITGTVAVGDPDADILVGFDATGVAPGTYTADIVVNSNDPVTPTVIVPVTMNVFAGITVDVKVFLEGPYDIGTGNIMFTDLNAGLYIPLAQPYNPALPYYDNLGPDWLYAGSESVTAIPAGAVDWVLVQARDAVDAPSAGSGTIEGTAAGFLMADGTIVGRDGVSPLAIFGPTIDNSLFLVVYHRNHLGVMSSGAVSMVGSVYTWDFTTGSGQAYGGVNAHKDLGDGNWGMVAGDVNGNSLIQNSDITNGWILELGSSGYLGSDMNLNGLTQNNDKTNFWVINNGNGGQVPAKSEAGGYESQVPK
jgi:hypothetical protein